MQILPSTVADKSVNIKNIQLIENNIHAGVKYLNFLRDRYFNEPEIDPAARVDFAWAAYNAGPARINRLRKKAAKTTSRYHIVRAGETLYRISRKYGITVKELPRLNRINASTIIRPGDRLKVTP